MRQASENLDSDFPGWGPGSGWRARIGVLLLIKDCIGRTLFTPSLSFLLFVLLRFFIVAHIFWRIASFIIFSIDLVLILLIVVTVKRK